MNNSRLFLTVIIYFLLSVSVVASDKHFCNLVVARGGGTVYFLNIDYEKLEMNPLHEVTISLNNSRDSVSVAFSADRSGDVAVFVGNRQDGWCEAQLYSNDGRFKKQLYKGKYLLSHAITNGNYIVYVNTEYGSGGGVMKNGKIIRNFSDNCRYVGISGDVIYLSKGNALGCHPLFALDINSQKTKVVYDRFDGNSDFKFIDNKKCVFLTERGEGGKQLAGIIDGKYRDLTDNYLMQGVYGFNLDYVFVLGGIVEKSRWRENCNYVPGEPKLFNVKKQKIEYFRSYCKEIFEGLDKGKYSIDMY
ncbi:MAG TPA: hypothetical protein PLH65_01775 [bacterium]|nr:hypothetical protein [bacterium]